MAKDGLGDNFGDHDGHYGLPGSRVAGMVVAGLFVASFILGYWLAGQVSEDVE